MIFFKILTQIITGISGLAAIYLDYKWHDKRTSKFKKGRDWLIILTIVSLISGIVITAIDENEKSDEIANWKGKFDTAQKTLDYIKLNGDSLKSQLNPFIKTIKDFEVLVSVEFSGKWKDPPYPDWSQPPSPQEFLMWSDTTKNLPDIKFMSPKIYFKTINKNTALFENRLSVQLSEFPLGKTTEILKGYNKMSFHFPFNQPDNLIDFHIMITKLKIVFYINGLKNGEISVSNYEIPLTRGTTPIISPQINMFANLVEALQIK